MKRLHILWTTAEVDTVKNMIFMYATNSISSGWWEEVNIIIWGASAKLVSEDEKIQKGILKMIDSGVKIEACKACANKYKATEMMTELGIDVRYMGSPLTKYLKSEDKMITI